MPYFSKEPYGSFKCPVYSTYTWDLGLKSRPKDKVRQGIKLTTPGLTVQCANPRVRSAGVMISERTVTQLQQSCLGDIMPYDGWQYNIVTSISCNTVLMDIGSNGHQF